MLSHSPATLLATCDPNIVSPIEHKLAKLMEKDKKALSVAKFHCPGATMLKEQDRCWGCCDAVAVLVWADQGRVDI